MKKISKKNKKSVPKKKKDPFQDDNGLNEEEGASPSDDTENLEELVDIPDDDSESF